MSVPVRSERREAAWRKQVVQQASAYLAIEPDKADEIGAELEKQLAEGPDFARYRRGSRLMEAPQVNTDRNFCARLMFIADTIERKTWRHREKGKHGGQIGRSAITLLRVLLFVVKKTKGRLCPSYDHLARLCRLSRRAVVNAMQTLKRMGFVTIHRRCQRVRLPLGIRVVQDSNAYEYHMPLGWGALAWSIFRPSSECTKLPATAVRKENTLSVGVKLAMSRPMGPPQRAYEDESAPPMMMMVAS